METPIGPERKVFVDNVEEDVILEQLGYTQELKRSFGLVGMVGFSFSIVTSWTALGGVLIVGVGAGGPPVMIWSWVGICIATLTVAYSMAEMCSAYPVAGGQYSWVAILAPQRCARGFSYVCGWFMLIGVLAMGATNNFIAANFFLGMANLNNPDYTIERWHTVLVSYLIAFLATGANIGMPHFLDKISKGVLIWNICAFFTVFITILAMNDHKQPASFVFGKFENFTGFNPAYAAILGILQSAFGMCCYDAPSHMTEEMRNARKEAPRAMVMAVYIGAITGFVFLIALSFCIGDLEATADTPTGVPLLEIFYNSTGSVGGACALLTLVALIAIFCANSLMAEGSRSIYAFARDHGLPFSGSLSKVSKKHIPVNAVLLTLVVQMALNSIYFGTLTGFETVIAMSTEGFYLSYAMPLLARIFARITGKKHQLEGPYSLGRFGLLLNVVGFVFLTFCCITFNFPSISPVTSEHMNYVSAAIGVVMLVSGITWITTGRKRFTGPDSGNLFSLGREENA
ncbi:GABA permease [Delitschia confertaspora ATCC 74209]|uniref:GABA permease n=1 Tax=Delitschia confertaspora ATCC 74209 TaxID=1513339 RepID=A0A9P4MPW6_9PLEO|nr:GABA permease [Delitschia confertaspora ATCC 74209]